MLNKLIDGAKGCLSCVIKIRHIGVLITADGSGMDEEVIAVSFPHITERYESIHDHTDLPEITLNQKEHFLEHFKNLEPGKVVKIGEWKDEETANEMITAAIERDRALSLTIDQKHCCNRVVYPL